MKIFYEQYSAYDVMRAHQYLYYVLASPAISDKEYDDFCKEFGLYGGGGSDCSSHYSLDEKKLATKLLTNRKK